MSEFLSFEDIEQLEKEAEQLFQQNAFGACERLLQRLIAQEPLKADYFGQLGQVHAKLGATDLSEIARHRERQLRIIEASAKKCPAVDRIEALWAGRANEDSAFSIDGFEFSKEASAESRVVRKGIVERVSLCGEALLQVCSFTEHEVLFERGTEVLAKLTKGRCQTSPRLISEGRSVLSENFFSGSGSRLYRIVSYLRADRGGFGYGDLIFALLEHQAMGFYVNDLSIENIRYDSITSLLRFSDYSKSVGLSESVRCLSPRDFLEWCRMREQERLSDDERYSFLLGSCQGQEWIWEGSRLKAPAVQIIRRQKHASLPEHSIQSVETDALSFKGIIDWPTKSKALKAVAFSEGERVLDIGCGMGEGVRYFLSQGCVVTGVDTEPRLVAAGQVISNIAQDGASFLEHDFDYESLHGEWDTIALLAALHHFTHLEEAVRRILACCRKRILVESAWVEMGYKWIGPWYRSNLAWKCDDEASFVAFLESVFEGFRLVDGPIESAHGRKLFVLSREGVEDE